MNQELLRIFKDARALLEKSYVKWTTDDGEGGHCQLGCLQVVTGMTAIWEHPAYALIQAAAGRLHPELKGAIAPRNTIFKDDKFDQSPSVYVNNQLGKEAILAVYDDEIARLEVAILVEEEKENARRTIPDTQRGDRIHTGDAVAESVSK